MKEERTCSGGTLVGRTITVPLLPRGETESQRSTDTCQVNRQIRERASPKFQQTILSSARGPGQVDGNLLIDDSLGFHGGQDTVCGRRNRQRHVIF